MNKREDWMMLSHGSKRTLRMLCRAVSAACPVEGMSRKEHERAVLELVQLGLLKFSVDEAGNLISFELTDLGTA